MNTRRSMAFTLAAGLAALAGVARAEAASAPDPAMAAVLDYVQGQRTTGFLVIQDRRPLVERNGHHLQVNMANGPTIIHGDPTRLTQVVANLLNNAAKYTPPGGRIRLDVEREKGNAVIRVKDNGIGIDPAALPHVFDMFAQVDPAQKTHAGGGLGIGLDVVQRLVRMHKGEVEGHSDGPGKGSEFVVRLPLADSPAPAKVVARPRAEQDGEKKRVLVVDDNQDAAVSMSQILIKRGHEVQVAHDGEQALPLGEKFRPDVVLMDIGMPKMNGYDACTRMRGTPWGKGIHIIALSGWGQEEDRKRSTDAGFDVHLVKPIDGATLRRMISELPPRSAD